MNGALAIADATARLIKINKDCAHCDGYQNTYPLLSEEAKWIPAYVGNSQ